MKQKIIWYAKAVKDWVLSKVINQNLTVEQIAIAHLKAKGLGIPDELLMTNQYFEELPNHSNDQCGLNAVLCASCYSDMVGIC